MIVILKGIRVHIRTRTHASAVVCGGDDDGGGDGGYGNKMRKNV